MGRRYEPLHQILKSLSEEKGYSLIYQKEQLVFPNLNSMRVGLANTKIMICFPQSFTHPEVTGGVETLTRRYLEGIGSGCVIFGKAPKELIDLSGYNPVVEIDTSNPASQISQMLGDIESFDEKVNRNVKTLAKVGQWSQRINRIETAKRAMENCLRFYIDKSHSRILWTPP